MNKEFLNYHESFCKRYEIFYQNFKTNILQKDISETLKSFLFYTPDLKGKLLRSFFAFRSCELCEIPEKIKENISISIELFQSFTLIHDDLPSLDNDDTRRGKPSLHKVAGDANAILIGDALSQFPFLLLTEPLEENENQTYLSGILGFLNKFSAFSIFSLIDGQIEDLKTLSKKSSKEEILKMYEKKTANFFAISLSSGPAIKKDYELEKDLYEAGKYFGMSFQLIDDIIDLEKEKIKNSLSFANLFGIKETRYYIEKYSKIAIDKIKLHDPQILYPFFEYYLSQYKAD